MTNEKFFLEEQAVALEDAAVQQYEAVIERSREYQIANQWTKATLVALNELRKSEWPLQKDAKRYVEPIAFGTPGLMAQDGTNYVPPAPKEPEVEEETPADGESVPAEGDAVPAEGADPSPPMAVTLFLPRVNPSPPTVNPLMPKARPIPVDGESAPAEGGSLLRVNPLPPRVTLFLPKVNPLPPKALPSLPRVNRSRRR